MGVTVWRLPKVTDAGTPGCNSSFGGTDCGYNVNLSTGEMAHMFYSTLGNTARYNTSGIQQPCYTAGPNRCLTNDGPFSDFHADTYWTGTTSALDASSAWYFAFQAGAQSVSLKQDNRNYAWLVHDGDLLAATVPIPPAFWLLGSALGVLGWLRRQVANS